MTATKQSDKGLFTNCICNFRRFLTTYPVKSLQFFQKWNHFIRAANVIYESPIKIRWQLATLRSVKIFSWNFHDMSYLESVLVLAFFFKPLNNHPIPDSWRLAEQNSSTSVKLSQFYLTLAELFCSASLQESRMGWLFKCLNKSV